MVVERLTTDPPIQYVYVDGLRLAYRESGTRGKPSMILLHGLAETSAFFWRPLIAYYQDKYHIFAFDLLGHGDSDDPDNGYGAERQAWLIAQATIQLGMVPSVWIGHSFGGMVATMIALQWEYLVQKLVLYDTPLPDNLRNNVTRFVRYTPLRVSLVVIPLTLPFMARALYTPMPIRMILKLLLQSWRVPYHAEILDAEFLSEAERHSGYALFETAQLSFRVNLIKELEHLRVPTCIIMGDSDLMVPIAEAEQWAKRLPNGHLEVISNAGHVSLLDAPAAFNQALERFLSD
jgi:3-oxoadipate enol-lactonase